MVRFIWSQAGGGFALVTVGLTLLLSWQKSVSVAARLLRTTNQRLWRVIDHYVVVTRTARGLRNFHYCRISACLKAGGPKI